MERERSTPQSVAQPLFQALAQSANRADSMACSGVLRACLPHPVASCVPNAAEPTEMDCSIAQVGALFVQHDCAPDSGALRRGSGGSDGETQA
ncbi:hypothetical protein FGB62_1g245 [Gracilaria domingensis]|nr:hypothetical protein FGB62_1g245 [Gracilaria domingensis]